MKIVLPGSLPFPDEEFVGGGVIPGAKGEEILYELWTTNAQNSSAVEAVETLQEEFAEYHRSMSPGTDLSEWRTRLSNGDVARYISDGVLVIRAIVGHSPTTSRIIGYISGKRLSDGILFINHIIVSAAHRQHGVGMLLFRAFLHTCLTGKAAFTEVRLSVYNSNAIAIRWYESMGFSNLPRKKAVKVLNANGDVSTMILKRSAIGRIPHGEFAVIRDTLSKFRALACQLVTLKVSAQALARQLDRFQILPACQVDKRLHGWYTISLPPEGLLWGHAHVGLLNVGCLIPFRIDAHSHVRELRILAAATDGKMWLNDSEAVLKCFDTKNKTIRWVLKHTGVETLWTQDATIDTFASECGDGDVQSEGTSWEDQSNKAVGTYLRRCKAAVKAFESMGTRTSSPGYPFLKSRTEDIDTMFAELWDAMGALGRCKLRSLASRVLGLRCSVQPLAPRMQQLHTSPNCHLDNRLLGRWTITARSNIKHEAFLWGVAYVGPLNVGYWQSMFEEDQVRGFCISCLSTDGTMQLNGDEATAIGMESQGSAIRWILKTGAETLWQRVMEDKDADIDFIHSADTPPLELCKKAIAFHVDRCSKFRRELEVLDKDADPRYNHLKPRVVDVCANINEVEQHLQKTNRLWSVKRPAQVLD